MKRVLRKGVVVTSISFYRMSKRTARGGLWEGRKEERSLERITELKRGGFLSFRKSRVVAKVVLGGTSPWSALRGGEDEREEQPRGGGRG